MSDDAPGLVLIEEQTTSSVGSNCYVGKQVSRL